MKEIHTPISGEIIKEITIGEVMSLTGEIYVGRDTVLPKIAEMAEQGATGNNGILLKGSAIFHSAVSCAGIGPTSSNKTEIEESIPILSKAGVRLHIGKGKLKDETIAELHQYASIYAVIPPVTALLKEKMVSEEIVAFPELGMEAFRRIVVNELPIVIAAAHGKSIY